MNEKIFVMGCSIFAVAALFFLPNSWVGAAEIVTLHLMQIALLLAFAFGTLFFLKGTRYDIHKEIFEENSISAAVYAGAIILALAMVIGK